MPREELPRQAELRAKSADLVVPDILPFVDEIFLALLTAIFGLWKDRRTPAAPPAVDVKRD